jgi:hypothetical protein
MVKGIALGPRGNGYDGFSVRDEWTRWMRQKSLSTIETLRKPINMETLQFYSISAQVITRDVFTSTSYICCEDTRT